MMKKVVRRVSTQSIHCKTYLGLFLYIASYSFLHAEGACSLGGELCLWNTNGFRTTVDGEVVYLAARSNSSELLSLTYEGNQREKCSLSVQYRSEDNSILYVYVLYTNGTVRRLGLLKPADVFSWTTKHILVPVTNSRFNLQIYSLPPGNGTSQPVTHIKAINLQNCTPRSLLSSSPNCIVKNGEMCIGWKTITQASNQSYRWIPRDDYLVLDTSKIKRNEAYKFTKLQSPSLPIDPSATGDCTITLKYKFQDFLYHFNIPRIRFHVKFLDSYGKEIDYLTMKVTMIGPGAEQSNDWQTLKRRINLKGKAYLAKRFMVELVDYAFSPMPGRSMIKDLQLSPNCVAQLPVFTKKPTTAELNAVEEDTIGIDVHVKARATGFSFTTCGSRGRVGPTNAQCLVHYLGKKPFVNVSIDDEELPGVQIWKVPKTHDYHMLLYGAHGGLGIDTRDSSGMVRGKQYMKSNTAIQLWPSMMHVRAKLYKDETVYVVVGQNGGKACEKGAIGHCKQSNKTSQGGGGGGGGGASMIAVERNGSIEVLAVAAGGGGMGRFDMDATKNVAYQLCSEAECRIKSARPGYGGSINSSEETFDLRQDGKNLFPLNASSLKGGQGCHTYEYVFDTHGGFGGGGGACTAGGGGGGFIGGRVSLSDSPEDPGLQGQSYYNRDLVNILGFEQHDPFSIELPNGWVEITEQPPACPCSGKCIWEDGNYTTYECICTEDEVLAEDNVSCKKAGGARFGQSRSLHLISNETILIILVVLGVIVITVVAIVFLSFCKGRKLRQKQVAARPLSLESNPLYQLASDNQTDAIPEERIKCIRCLGEGRFSQVFEARMSLDDAWDSEEISVAVKKPIVNSEQTRIDFLREAHTISSLNHPNIMKILGIVIYSDDSVGIVMDVLKGGDLRSFLRENKLSQSDKSEHLEVTDLLRIASEISSACRYLEELKFIHRDIAARNILLTEKGKNRVAKISDFGLSRDINQGDYFCNPHRQVPIRWYPPEAIKKNVHTPKSDVWSFGILLWEIFTLGDQPYPGIDNDHVAGKIADGFTMDPPPKCPRQIGDLMEKCWAYEPEARPYFSHIYQEISHLLQNSMDLTLNFHILRPSLGSSASSGFDETLDSPESTSGIPLLHDMNYSTSHMIHEKEVSMD